MQDVYTCVYRPVSAPKLAHNVFLPIMLIFMLPKTNYVGKN